MRSLNKKGFFVYAVGELLPFTAYYFIQPTGLAAMIGLIVSVVVVIVFLGLYISQLRYMK
jgi:VIT1/CCC1 family predicted Fe2+/Mn2+ transporter